MTTRPSWRTARLVGAWALRGARRRIQRHGLILLYHRIARNEVDPWNLCVSPGHFREHIGILRRRYRIVPLAELPDAVRRGRRAKPPVAITFDDGYADNLEEAAPVLRSCDAPATVFLATGWVGRRLPYWWDRLSWIVLGPHHLPDRLEIAVDGVVIRWRGAGREAVESRQRLHARLWAELRQRDEPVRDDALRQLAAWSGTDAEPAIAGRPMDTGEVRRLVADGTIGIGAHSVSHAVLPGLPAERREAEILQSLSDCERLTGRRPDAFAYPYGDLDGHTVAATRSAGVRLACSTRKNLLWPDTDPLALPRLAVGDWPGSRFERWLRWYCLP